MTAVLLEARPALFAELPGAPGPPRRQTLEERLDATWRSLLATGRAECPVCGATMEAKGAAGQCGGCGSALS